VAERGTPINKHSGYIWGPENGGAADLPTAWRKLAEVSLNLEAAEVELQDAQNGYDEAAEDWGRVRALVDAGEAAIRAQPGGAAALRDLPDPRFAAASRSRTPAAGIDIDGRRYAADHGATRRT
jgi:hypothetical protein